MSPPPPPPPPPKGELFIVLVSDCESSNSKPEATYKLLSDDEADGDFLSDIEDEFTYRDRITGEQEIKQ